MVLGSSSKKAIADALPAKKLHHDSIMPGMYDKKVQKNIAATISRLKAK
ncbi:MAG: hypothetical protein KGH88_01300 [Thaumarchaeota archaeon]|nr:hypothetical protein [Nitrososphaerota archaeon]